MSKIVDLNKLSWIEVRDKGFPLCQLEVILEFSNKDIKHSLVVDYENIDFMGKPLDYAPPLFVKEQKPKTISHYQGIDYFALGMVVAGLFLYGFT